MLVENKKKMMFEKPRQVYEKKYLYSAFYNAIL